MFLAGLWWLGMFTARLGCFLLIWDVPCSFGVFITRLRYSLLCLGCSLLFWGVHSSFGMFSVHLGCSLLIGMLIADLGCSLLCLGCSLLIWGVHCWFGIFPVHLGCSTAHLGCSTACLGCSLLLWGVPWWFGVFPARFGCSLSLLVQGESDRAQQPLEGALGGIWDLCCSEEGETQEVHTFGDSAGSCSPGRGTSPSAQPAAHPDQH